MLHISYLVFICKTVFITVFKQNTFSYKMHHSCFLVFISKTVFRQNYFFVRKCITLVSLSLYVKLFLGKITFLYENASRTCFLVFISKTVLGRITFSYENASHTCFLVFVFITVVELLFRTKMHQALVFWFSSVKLFLGRITFSYGNASHTYFLVFI